MNILIVDDDTDYLFQQKRALEKLGYTVRTADCVATALVAFEVTPPDLAVLDLMMEDLDSGFLLARKFKKMKPSIPVILLTGVTRETGRVFERGMINDGGWNPADRVLSKPVLPETLKREIDKLVKQ